MSLHNDRRKKPRPPIHWHCRGWIANRAKKVEGSLDKMFGKRTRKKWDPIHGEAMP